MVSGKTSIFVIVAALAILGVLFGYGNSTVAGMGMATILLGLLAIASIDLFNIPMLAPFVASMLGRVPRGQLVVIWIVLLLMNLGVIGALVSSPVGSGAVGGIGTLSTGTLSSSQPSGTAEVPLGESHMGEFEFWPYAASGAGATYSGSGAIYIIDSTGDMFDDLKAMEDAGGVSGLKYKGTDAPGDSSVSSGEFSITSLSARAGEKAYLFGYQDRTPAAAESISWKKEIMLTGFNDNQQKWEWAFTDGSQTSFAWRNYSTLDWSDHTETVRDTYVENLTAAQTERPYTVYVFPANNGEQVMNAGLFFEATTANASNFKKSTITSPAGSDGKKVIVDETALTNVETLSSDNPLYIAQPTKSGTSTTMYFVTRFPEPLGGAIRESTNKLAKFTIDLKIDHPGTTPALYYLHGVQNLDAKSKTGGHFDFADDFLINQTSNLGTTGFS